MYKIVICDDDHAFALRLKDMVAERLENIDESAEIAVFTDGKSVLANAGTHADLYLLDEEMPGMSGMELACLIRESSDLVSIIFISNIHDAVFHSLQYSPLRYIRKSHLEAELEEALNAFIVRHKKLSQKITLEIQSERGQKTALLLQDIIYIESQKHYVIFHCLNKTYQTRGKLTDFEEQLTSHHFARCSQSFIANMRYTTAILSKQIVVGQRTELPLSRKYNTSFIKAYMAYKRTLGHGTLPFT